MKRYDLFIRTPGSELPEDYLSVSANRILEILQAKGGRLSRSGSNHKVHAGNIRQYLDEIEQKLFQYFIHLDGESISHWWIYTEGVEQ